jgi:uncharacterized RDD family membrane protein YckC
MIYEAILLFGVVFITGWIFDTLTQSRHALTLRHERQFWLFLALGAYFVFFWHRGGQTLAMKTWQIKIIAPGFENIPIGKAIMRYLLAWMWFLPAMAMDYALGLKGWGSIGVLAIGIALWAITALFDKDHQFLHDRLSGTYLINLSKTPSSHS